jgi:hypothetical protein
MAASCIDLAEILRSNFEGWCEKFSGLPAQICGFLSCLYVCIRESVVDLITLWSVVILGKLTVAYIVRFSAFYAT